MLFQDLITKFQFVHPLQSRFQDVLSFKIDCLGTKSELRDDDELLAMTHTAIEFKKPHTAMSKS